MRIKDAASIVLLDRRGPEPLVLMGRRAAKHKFMPNIYVFPGGRVDYGDRFVVDGNDYAPDTLDLLLQQMKGKPTCLRARMLGRAAIRETFEEVGLFLANKTDKPRMFSQKTWAPFASQSLCPDLSALTYIARAVTPPGQNRRFDTRFFMADVSHVLDDQEAISSDELEDVQWVKFEDGLTLPHHPITKEVLTCAKRAILEQDDGKTPKVSYYRPKPSKTGLMKNVVLLQAGAEPITGDVVQID